MRLIREGVFTPKRGAPKFPPETLFLRRAGAGSRGWLIEVLKCAERASAGSGGSDVVTLEEMYEARLGALHPGNNNVRAKVRQQLQVLRDAGLVAFLGGGRYRLVRREV